MWLIMINIIIKLVHDKPYIYIIKIILKIKIFFLFIKKIKIVFIVVIRWRVFGVEITLFIKHIYGRQHDSLACG